MEAKTEHLDQLTTLTKAKGFLGREFLTWLWYTAETATERMMLPDRTPGKELEVDFWVDDRMVLDGSSGQASEHVIKGGTASHSREAAASLATGKTVREMKLGVNVQGVGEFSAVLNCEDLNPRALRLPLPTGDGTAPVAAVPLANRLQQMNTFLAVLDALFAHFLTARCEPDWESHGLADMRAWIKRRQTKDEAALH